MNIDDFRLTKAEVHDTIKVPLSYLVPKAEWDVLKAIANTATDKAIKKIDECFDEATEYARLEDIFDTIFYFKQALKELVK